MSTRQRSTRIRDQTEAPDKRYMYNHFMYIHVYLIHHLYSGVIQVMGADSLREMKKYIDGIVMSQTCPIAAVHTINGVKVLGLYHHMEAGPHARVVAAISAHTQWASDCLANNVSAGKLFVVTAANE